MKNSKKDAGFTCIVMLGLAVLIVMAIMGIPL